MGSKESQEAFTVSTGLPNSSSQIDDEDKGTRLAATSAVDHANNYFKNFRSTNNSRNAREFSDRLFRSQV